jgi:hypothetical protein
MKPYRAMLVTLVTSGGSQRGEAYLGRVEPFHRWRFTIGELPAVKHRQPDAVVLRYDADAFESLGQLAQAQHFLGWFGGYGFGGTLGWMTNDLGFPAPLAALAILTEFFAPLALALGLGAGGERSLVNRPGPHNSCAQIAACCEGSQTLRSRI